MLQLHSHICHGNLLYRRADKETTQKSMKLVIDNPFVQQNDIHVKIGKDEEDRLWVKTFSTFKNRHELKNFADIEVILRAEDNPKKLRGELIRLYMSKKEGGHELLFKGYVESISNVRLLGPKYTCQPNCF